LTIAVSADVPIWQKCTVPRQPEQATKIKLLLGPFSGAHPDPFDTDTAFHFDTNPDSAFQIDPDPTV
jgi:hypothetical protein